jgi:hypothetical protein
VKWFLVAALVVIIALSIIFVVNQSVQSVKLKLSASAVEFGLERGQMDFTKVLRWVLSSDEARANEPGAADGIVPRLASRLRVWLFGARQATASSSDEKESRGEAQAILLAKVAGLPPEHPVGQHLRELVERGIGPFERREKRVKVSFQSGLGSTRAAACFESKFRNRRIALVNGDGSNGLELLVSSIIVPCEHSRLDNPRDRWIKVDHEVGRRLFREELRDFEDAIVVIDPPHDLLTASAPSAVTRVERP